MVINYFKYLYDVLYEADKVPFVILINTICN
jgi:hypothetical protein